MNRGSAVLLAIGLAVLGLADATARAEAEGEPPRIVAHSLELGLAGSVLSVEGASRVAVAARAGSFLSLGAGLGGLEVETRYAHRSSEDVLDLLGYLAWQLPLAGSALHSFAALGGGLRQEWLGSFRQTRYPVGVQLGIKLLASPSAALRTEYVYRRLLDDPVRDFDEHEWRFGFSLFLFNGE